MGGQAKNDLTNAAHVLKLAAACPTDTVCFHAQQCVEKYLKALLVLDGIDLRARTLQGPEGRGLRGQPPAIGGRQSLEARAATAVRAAIRLTTRRRSVA